MIDWVDWGFDCPATRSHGAWCWWGQKWEDFTWLCLNHVPATWKQPLASITKTQSVLTHHHFLRGSKSIGRSFKVEMPQVQRMSLTRILASAHIWDRIEGGHSRLKPGVWVTLCITSVCLQNIEVLWCPLSSCCGFAAMDRIGCSVTVAAMDGKELLLWPWSPGNQYHPIPLYIPQESSSGCVLAVGAPVGASYFPLQSTLSPDIVDKLG